jgi:dCMP deaminase
MERPSKEMYYLNIAQEVAKRGTCLRRIFGAVIVNHDQIVSTGYVGSPRGHKNCVDIGACLRNEFNIPQGQRYELCRSVHAEMNAVIHASRSEMLGGVMYIVGLESDGRYVKNAEPCKMCKRIIINSGIVTVFVRVDADNYKELTVKNWIDYEDKEFYGAGKVY